MQLMHMVQMTDECAWWVGFGQVGVRMRSRSWMQRDDAVGCRDNVVCNDVKMMQGRKRSDGEDGRWRRCLIRSGG
jgi:hypothetical protein